MHVDEVSIIKNQFVFLLVVHTYIVSLVEQMNKFRCMKQMTNIFVTTNVFMIYDLLKSICSSNELLSFGHRDVVLVLGIFSQYQSFFRMIKK